MADLVSGDPREGTMANRAASRLRRGLAVLLALAALACQSSGGMGLDGVGNGPGWAPFSGGRMFGAPL